MPEQNSRSPIAPAVRSALVEGLMRPGAFPHAVGRIRLVETHISWVILTGRHAYKIKKPLRLEFLDFSTLELRKHYCAEELRLNRRLAPEIYDSVVGIGGTLSAPRIGAEPVFEYALRMREFPAEAQLDRRLEEGELAASDLRALGWRIGCFHLAADAAGADSTYGDAAEVERAAVTNFAVLEPLIRDPVEQRAVSELARWTGAQSSALRATFSRRKAEGWVRDGHGDLHLSNLVALESGITAFDCLEFDPRLRWADVICDAAFLVMDLEMRGRPDLAYAFLDGYLETTGDYAGLALLDYYRVYRSLVRAKVAALRAEQVADRTALEERRRAHVELAQRYTRRRRPRLVLMHGYSGSGKSWLGERLATMLPAIRLRSDVERKRIAGLTSYAESHSGIGEQIYAPNMTRRTYAQLESGVRSALVAGESVVVDAAFLSREQRATFLRLARELGVACTIVDCVADRDVLETRIRRRERDASEANAAVLAYQLRVAEPLCEDEPVIAVRSDATLALQPLLRRIRAAA